MTDPGSAVPPFRRLDARVFRDGVGQDGARNVAEEVAVAMTFNRLTHAVMLATPLDLADFAVGFALAEGVVDRVGAVEELAVIDVGPSAVECRMWIAAEAMARLEGRRRRLAGVTGCGMCGLDSLDAALPPPSLVPDGPVFDAAAIARAVASLRPAQALNAETRAVHAAGFWTERDGLVALREDVGRHNALDKLRGALARADRTALADGLVVLSSRLSVELVQKAAAMGVAVLVGVSAPTALAWRTAEAAGMTLIGVARTDGFEVFTGARRIVDEEGAGRCRAPRPEPGSSGSFPRV